MNAYLSQETRKMLEKERRMERKAAKLADEKAVEAVASGELEEGAPVEEKTRRRIRSLKKTRRRMMGTMRRTRLRCTGWRMRCG